MDDNKYEQLQKDVNRMNEEGFVPEGQQLHVFRNADELIEAIRNNQVPGITWTEEDEAKWQAAEAIDKAFEESEEVETRTDEFNAPFISSASTPEEFFDDTVVEWSEEEWARCARDWGDLDDDDTIIQ